MRWQALQGFPSSFNVEALVALWTFALVSAGAVVVVSVADISWCVFNPERPVRLPNHAAGRPTPAPAPLSPRQLCVHRPMLLRGS